jgi:hypothetical protein
MKTHKHEMVRCTDGVTRAIYTDDAGREYAIIDGERDYGQGRYPCAWCDGDGKMDGNECSHCDGTGQASD